MIDNVDGIDVTSRCLKLARLSRHPQRDLIFSRSCPRGSQGNL